LIGVAADEREAQRGGGEVRVMFGLRIAVAHV
jgi:hypothetical protein